MNISAEIESASPGVVCYAVLDMKSTSEVLLCSVQGLFLAEQDEFLLSDECWVYF